MIKAIKIIIVSVITIMSLSGCVSQEEKEKANVIIEENKEIIENYVAEYLDGFKVNGIEMIYKSSEFLSLLSTNNLEFEVIRDTDTDDGESESYKYIYCTDTNELYTTYNTETFKDELVDNLKMDGVTVNVGFNPIYIVDNITVSQDYLHIGNLDDSGIFVENNKITPLNQEYTIYLMFETANKEKLIQIYSILDTIKDIDYQVKILIGAEKEDGFLESYIAKDIEEQDSLFDGPASIIKIQNKEGIITESIEKFDKISTDDFWILYNPLKYRLSIDKSSNTLLGQSNAEKSSKDYNILIESLDTNNTGTEFRIISNYYSEVIYTCNNSYFNSTDKMNKKSLFSLSTTCYKDIDVKDNCYSHSITIALYNQSKNTH